MGMLGNQLAAGQALTVANDSFNGDGSTTAFTLSQTVSSVNDIEVLVDNVQQSPYDSSYSVSGTTLTFSGAPSAGTNNVYVIYNASKHITTSQVIPDDGSVTHSKMHTNATLPITRDMINNRVGIGITNPSVDLEVSNSGNSFLLVKNTSSGSGLYIKADTDGDAELQTAGGSNTLGFRTSGTERMHIDASGRITKPNQPVWGASRSDGHVNAGNYVVYNQVVYNNGGHYDNTTGRFTAPVSGYYHVGVQHMNENNATYDNKYYEVRKNGAMFKRAYGSSGSNVHHQFVWHGVIYLNASDYVHVYNHNLTIYATGESHSYFSGYLIG